jgi:hypothetical protein
VLAFGPFLSPLSQFPCLNVECITYRSVASAMCQVLWRKFFDAIRLVTTRDEDVETMTEGALALTCVGSATGPVATPHLLLAPADFKPRSYFTAERTESI